MGFEDRRVCIRAREFERHEDVECLELPPGDATVSEKPPDAPSDLACGDAGFGNAVVGISGEDLVAKWRMVEEPRRAVGKNDRYVHMPPLAIMPMDTLICAASTVWRCKCDTGMRNGERVAWAGMEVPTCLR